jgi:hypothetical protein
MTSTFETPPDALTIAELFSRDPLKLERKDIRSIVAFYRSRQKQYNLGNMSAGAKPKVAPKAAAALALAPDIELDL